MPQTGGKPKVSKTPKAIIQLLLARRNTAYMFLQAHLPLPERQFPNSALRTKRGKCHSTFERLHRGPRRRLTDPI